MNPILAALEAAAAQLIQSTFGAVATVLVEWFTKHVLPKDQGLQAVPKAELRAAARAWVKDMLAEFGRVLVAKNVVPVFLQPFLPLMEAGLEQAIEAALDAAGL